MMGLPDEGGAQSKDANSELESSEIQSNSIDQNQVDETKDTQVDDKEETSVSFKSFHRMTMIPNLILGFH